MPRAARSAGSSRQSIELLGRRQACYLASKLTFANSKGHLNADENVTGRPEILETQHGTDSTFDRSMILLDQVVQVLVLSNLDPPFAFGVDVLHGGEVGATLVEGHLLGLAVGGDGVLEKAHRRCLVAVSAEQEIHGVAGLIDRPVQVLPVAFHLDIGFVHAPAGANGKLLSPESRLHHRNQLDHPAMHSGVID